MHSYKRIHALFIVTFLLSITLSLLLALVNRQANDPHLEVARLIMQTNKLPTKDDCWECFQPKLYHATLAGIFSITTMSNRREQVQFANLVSWLAGALTLALIWYFIKRISFHPWLSLLAFAFVALNPKFIAISAQATNDSLIILFSSLALIMYYEFLRRDKISYFALAILFVTLAISIKSNGIVTFATILLVLLVQIIVDSTRRRRLETLALLYQLIILTLVILNPLNQYISNYQQYGSPFLLNIDRQPLPQFSQPTIAARPGILSIKDGFLTFKLYDLLAHPRIEENLADNQHRTSLWTQLYARAHSLHFDNWPKSWSTQGENIFPLLRAIYLLALLPTVLIFLGAFRQLWQLACAILRRDLIIASSLHFGLFPLVLSGYIAFVMLYALLYRDYAVMKAIFLFPALPAFPLVFLGAVENRPFWFHCVLTGISLPLLCLYVAEVVSLILQLG